MEKFKYGIMVLNPKLKSIKGDAYTPIVHFVGYWSEPQEEDFNHLMEELSLDESFDLIDIIDDLEFALAPDDVVEHFNNVCREEGVFNGEQDINEINLN